VKFITGILTLYLVALVVIPCVDVHNDHGAHHMELSVNITEGHHNGVDLCTPFCACNCCVSPIITQDYISQPNLFLFSQDHNSGYTSIYLSSPFTAIWQPPKIS